MEGNIEEAEEEPGRSRASLLSKRSGSSRSFETVINLDQQQQQQQQQRQRKGKDPTARASSSSSRRRSKRYRARDNLNSDSPADTEEEESVYFKRGEKTKDKTRRNDSSAVTTSDEERFKSSTAAPTASSTMESAQIDRAKSFEYFPGDAVDERVLPSAAQQENSSSYEYLPGHLVSDQRPGTVVSNYRNEEESNSSERRMDGLLEDEDLRLYLGEELNDRSRQLLEAHFRKTRRFYRRVKRCLAFASQPASSAEDSRRKQEVMEHLMLALEGRGGLDDVSVTSEESTTKQVQTETTDGRRDNRTEMSTPTAEDEEEATTAKIASTSSRRMTPTKEKKLSRQRDIEMHQKRIEQLRAVRKEMRKLEELESAHLRHKLGRSANREQSEDTEISSGSTSLKKTPRPAPATKGHSVDKVKDLDRDVKGSSKVLGEPKRNPTVQQPSSRPRSTETYSVKRSAISGAITKSKTHIIVTSAGPPPQRVKSGRAASTSSESSSAAGLKSRAEFGQTYPTPREEKATMVTNRAVQTNGESAARQRPPQPPQAYYLPLGGQSVIKIGTRRLKEVQEEDGSVSKENRSILANYIAGIQVESIRRRQTKEEEEEENGEKKSPPQSQQPSSSKYTLRDALSLRRPDFVEEAERRRSHLLRMRQARLENEATRRRWAEELARMTPRFVQFF